MRREEEKTGGKRGKKKQRKERISKKKKGNRWDENNNFMDNFVNKIPPRKKFVELYIICIKLCKLSLQKRSSSSSIS